MKVGDLVRWKKHWGLIISQGKAEPRGKGWYTVSWLTPWIHVGGTPAITESTMHEEFLEVIREDK
tara:strand:+ start:1076 stop:1270 length:195 start_codon:yes stop_codon:yes gene_type:complete